MIIIPAPIFIGMNSSRNPGFPTKVGNQLKHWTPVFTGETTFFETKKMKKSAKMP